MSSFKCCDMGWDCPFEVTGEPRNDIARNVIHHIHADHGIDVMPNEIIMRAHDAIRSDEDRLMIISGMSEHYHKVPVT